MARPRRKDRLRFPKGVYFVGGRYVYREYLGVKDDKPRFAPDKRLCGKGASEAQVWIAYNGLMGVERGQTLRKLFDLFMASPKWQERSIATRRIYADHYDAICQTPVSGRPFGDVPYASITRGAVQAYVEFKGKETRVLANRHLAAMGAAFAWSATRDMVAVNPCSGVIRFKERPRLRYVTDDEYTKVHKLAPVRLKVAMELAYLCRLREIEICNLTRADALDNGLLARRVKGSKTQIIGSTERLQDALKLAKKISTAENIKWILPALDGGRLTPSGLRTQWQRFRSWLREEKKIALDWTFHDLKAKGVSDFDGSKKLAGGHKTETAAAVYDRRLEIVQATR